MNEENQNLVQDEMPEENVVTIGPQEPRAMICDKKGFLPGLAVFVALLLAGQAVSVYFITQQQSKISDLDTAMKQMKLEAMIKKLPGSPPSQIRPQMRMANFNIPLAFGDNDGSQQKLAEKAKASNSIEDAARYMLQMSNPLRKYPSFNDTVLDNLRKLRKTLSYQEWMLFDNWMQQWYLFYLVQNSKMPEETLTPQEKTVPGAPLITQCQMKAQAHVMPGAYKPQCDENGDFQPIQCWRSTGYCWCVYRNGTEVPETRTRAKLDCSDISGVDMFLKMED
ncbi:HLA class II histocompatibility antigen gamma chain isoform X3 [Hyla sarda]|uniref:HLA class II histocompatibility antigen gamma chain isoform X3 n=1 Tax=Hyla sarda TaxID=327740 RepID=UPI0024C42E9D|nr:HLA class II histocompatibility antigen gamma chain isoform X3 [Hyla sarda]